MYMNMFMCIHAATCTYMYILQMYMYMYMYKYVQMQSSGGRALTAQVRGPPVESQVAASFS